MKIENENIIFPISYLFEAPSRKRKVEYEEKRYMEKRKMKKTHEKGHMEKET